MAAAPSHETGHTDTVHDVQLDYYGRKLATASSDRTIKVFDIAGDQLTPLATLQGHEGPVWQVSWSHPKYGNLLASCSFDNRIMIWKEQQGGSWIQVAFLCFQSCPLSTHTNIVSFSVCQVYTSDSSLHTASVNSIAFAPHELGLKVAAASSDGTASVLSYQSSEAQWDHQKVSWLLDLHDAAMITTHMGCCCPGPGSDQCLCAG